MVVKSLNYGRIAAKAGVDRGLIYCCFCKDINELIDRIKNQGR